MEKIFINWLRANVIAKTECPSPRKIEEDYRWIKDKNEKVYKFLKDKEIQLKAKGKELFYLLFNDMNEKPVCKTCFKTVNFKSFTEGYKTYCSLKCFYNDEEMKQRIKETCEKRYGTDNVSKSDIIKQKKKETCLKNFGVDVPAKSEEILNRMKETSLRIYGFKSPLQNKVVQEKSKITCLEKYGVDNYAKTEEYNAKRILTCLERYGEMNNSQTIEYQEMVYNTRKKNKTFNTSKTEIEIFHLLKEYFTEVETQYKSNVYPFNCDFYIPSLDLYIEYQGSWTHGKEPFDENNEEHLKLLEHWKQKSGEVNFKGKKKSYFLQAIKTWTSRDVEKRNWALYNNLNWIEFFNEKEINEWLKKNKNMIAQKTRNII